MRESRTRLCYGRRPITVVQCVRIDCATGTGRFVRTRSVKGNGLIHIGRIRSGREDGNGKTGLTEGIADSRVATGGASRLDGFQEPCAYASKEVSVALNIS